MKIERIITARGSSYHLGESYQSKTNSKIIEINKGIEWYVVKFKDGVEVFCRDVVEVWYE
jgi:hypothetical protein